MVGKNSSLSDLSSRAAALAFLAAAAACMCACTHEDSPLAEEIAEVTLSKHSGNAADTKSIHDKYPWQRNPLDYKGLFVIEECDLENPGVRAFLDKVDYSKDFEYSDSEVSKYIPNGSDKPQPLIIKWEGEATNVELSTSPFFDKDVIKPQIDGSSATVYNLIPGIVYYYRVMDEDGSVIRRACVNPTGPVRMINGVSKNVRDLGGWKADGGHIAYGRLYRGARLDDIQGNPTEKDVLFKTLGVSVDLDLRGLPKGTLGGSGEMNPWTGSDPIEYVNIKLWHYFVPSARQYEGPNIADGVTSGQYQLAIRSIINWLAEERVVYFHCHGGSDRTGTLAFLIEALLGVSEEDLSKDYELTSFVGFSGIRERNGKSGWFFAPMVRYLRQFAPEGNIKDQVTAWAITRHSEEVAPLSKDEIELLRSLLIVKE